MELLKEVTVWNSTNTPNHSYAINMAGRMVAYLRYGDAEWTVFKKPMSFDKRRRKFVKINDPKLNAYFAKFESRPKDAVVYKSSNGNEYIIHNGKCNCPGFTFRGKCKHVNISQK